MILLIHSGTPRDAQDRLPRSDKRSRNSSRSSFRPFRPPRPQPQHLHHRHLWPTHSFTGSIPPLRQRWDGSGLVWPVRMGGSTSSSSSMRGVSPSCPDHRHPRPRRSSPAALAQGTRGLATFSSCFEARDNSIRAPARVSDSAQIAGVLRQRASSSSADKPEPATLFAFKTAYTALRLRTTTTCILDRGLVLPSRDPAAPLLPSVFAAAPPRCCLLDWFTAAAPPTRGPPPARPTR